MLFNSILFIGFFAVVLGLYWRLPSRYRWLLLLFAGYLFYASWNPVYLVLIAFTTIFNYTVARQFLARENESKKRLGLWLSLLVNLGLLAYFKYYNFFVDQLSELWQILHISKENLLSEAVLPVGISFYTFQSLSYIFDLYRGKIEAEKHLGKFALFSSFFPLLLAGPIEKARNLLPQLQELNPTWNPVQLQEGFTLFLFGLFKKVVVADKLAIYLQPIFASEHSVSGANWLMAAYFYPLRLYADFSGYTDMARGLACMLGIRTGLNFNHAFQAQSLTDFWRKWHISLTSWFIEYLFTPLHFALRRYGTFALFFSILLTFTLSGLWHEASWNFIIWGALNGLILCLEFMLPWKSKSKNKVLRLIRIVFTYQLISFTFLFISTNDLQQCWQAIQSFANINGKELFQILALLKSSNLLISLILYLGISFLFRKKTIESLAQRPWFSQYAFYLSLLFAIILFGETSGSPFIYFRF